MNFRTLALLLLGLPSFVSAATLQPRTDGVLVHLPNGYLEVRFFSDSIVHVQFAKDKKFFDHKTLDVIGKPQPKVTWKLHRSTARWVLQGPQLGVAIDPTTGKVQFLRPDGSPILSEDERTLEPAQLQGEKTFHVRQQWAGVPDESLYGLGQQQIGVLDLKGYDLDLWQHNTHVAVPFLVSSRGYGIFWENTSYTRFGDLRDFTPIPSEDLLDQDRHPGGLTTGPLEGSGPVSTSADIAVTFQGKNWNDHYPATYWSGFLKVPETGDYQFHCDSNGGIKVLLDTKTIMDHWRQKWLAADDQAKVHLTAGQLLPLRIEWRTEQGSTLRFTWKTPSPGTDTSLWSEMGDGVDYYFVLGPSLDQVVAGYRTLTGQAPLMPDWAFGLWQSRQRYETEEDSLKVVDEFRKRGIPFDNIVQDWRYWPDGKWGSHAFDPERFPDPQAWIKELHDKHTHVMISVWGKYYPGTDNFGAMNTKGYLYQPLLKEGIKDWLGEPYTFYDAFNPGARKLFWKQLDRDLFSMGIDAWWMDATEPDLMPSPPTLEGQEAHMDPTYLGPGAKFLNAYPLMNSQGIYDGQRKSAPNQRVFILTRSGYAGSQRAASSIWSGDITSTWSALRKQIPAGLNMSLAGIPYWTTDIGGYTMQRKFSDKDMKPEDAEEWRELNARWFEFGTFCPLLRVHGELRHREMWELGDKDSPVYQAELKFDRLRYQLFPYLYSLAWKVTRDGGTFLRPLVMDYPNDPNVRDLTDEYMFGNAFLVCPVTHYKARSRQVYLPEGIWYDFWTGKVVPPGDHEAEAPYDRIPVFVKGGSIIPFGPDLQYIGEKPQDPITLHVYAGADGDLTLYEDDGTTYGYEKGLYRETPIHWGEADHVLTIGGTKGSWQGPAKKLKTVFIDKNSDPSFTVKNDSKDGP